jgi:hypothetical protein
MPIFKLNRNYALSSTLGHSINFIKGEEVYVPQALVKEVVALGAECVDGDAQVLEDEVTPIQLTQDELVVKLESAFTQLVARNDPDEFTAQGVPKVTVIEGMLGLKVTKTEVISAWQVFRAKDES